MSKPKRKPMCTEALISSKNQDNAIYYDTSTKDLEYLCHHYPASFYEEGITWRSNPVIFKSVEQYKQFFRYLYLMEEMYHRKISLSDVEKIIDDILESEGLDTKKFEFYSVFESYFSFCKKTKKDLYTYMCDKFNELCDPTLFRGNYNKFSQNTDLLEKLLNTNESPLRLKRGRFAKKNEEIITDEVLDYWFLDAYKNVHNGQSGDILMRTRHFLRLYNN